MGQQNRYTDEQLITLLWLKVLDDLDEGIVKGMPFEEKYTMLDKSDLSDISEDDFDKAVDFWMDEGIFNMTAVGGEVSIVFTTLGRQLFDKLNEDSTIAELENLLQVATDTEKPKKNVKVTTTIKEFVIEHRDEIGSFIGSVIGGFVKSII